MTGQSVLNWNEEINIWSTMTRIDTVSLVSSSVAGSDTEVLTSYKKGKRQKTKIYRKLQMTMPSKVSKDHGNFQISKAIDIF